MNIFMKKMHFLVVFTSLLVGMSAVNAQAEPLTKGIYITQNSLEDTRYITYLIQQAKASGIDTFVIDLMKPSKAYENNIKLVLDNKIKYVARIVIFPDGGTDKQVLSEAYWERRYILVKAAAAYGAEEIQLDYIRYDHHRPASAQNSENIHQVIKWYKEKLKNFHIPLQIDVFGISAYGESKHIGQNIKLFADTIDVLCPMLYPSHFEPYKLHAVTPYKTVLQPLLAIKKQFQAGVPFRLNPYIELSNYRYPLSNKEKLAYIYAQIKAVEDSGAHGWYAWSAHNEYDNLFHVLQSNKIK